MESSLLIILFFEYSAENWQEGRTRKEWSIMNAQLSEHFSPGNILSMVSLSTRF